MITYKIEKHGEDLVYKGVTIQVIKEHKGGRERFENTYVIAGVSPAVTSKSIFELCRLIEKGEINGRKSETCAG